mmetsp:Transcript_16112/g.21293  ORF Transcript_16112/g.21293 Transcript_16112/m.21293 type:complete len:422 (+) Transcript_16112:55-1320(+)
MAPKRKGSTRQNKSSSEEDLPTSMSWYKDLTDGVENILGTCSNLVGDNRDFDHETMKMSLLMPLLEAKQNFLALNKKVETFERAFAMVAVGYQAVMKFKETEAGGEAKEGGGDPTVVPLVEEEPSMAEVEPEKTPLAASPKPPASPQEDDAPETLPEPHVLPPRRTRKSSQPQPVEDEEVEKGKAPSEPFNRTTAEIIVGTTKVEREFPGFGKFVGTVGEKKGSLYRILYEDGDTEDFTTAEVRQYMLPDKPEGAQEPKKKKARTSKSSAIKAAATPKAKAKPKPKTPAPAPKVDHAHNTRHANPPAPAPASASATTPKDTQKAKKAQSSQKSKQRELNAIEGFTLEALTENPYLAVGCKFEEKFPGAGWYTAEVIEVQTTEKGQQYLIHYDDDTDAVKPIKTLAKKIDEFRKKLIQDSTK